MWGEFSKDSVISVTVFPSIQSCTTEVDTKIAGGQHKINTFTNFSLKKKPVI